MQNLEKNQVYGVYLKLKNDLEFLDYHYEVRKRDEQEDQSILNSSQRFRCQNYKNLYTLFDTPCFDKYEVRRVEHSLIEPFCFYVRNDLPHEYLQELRKFKERFGHHLTLSEIAEFIDEQCHSPAAKFIILGEMTLIRLVELNQIKEYPLEWIKDLVKRPIHLEGSDFKYFERGLQEYYYDCSIEAKLLSFKLPPLFHKKLNLEFKICNKAQFKLIQDVEFTLYPRESRHALLKSLVKTTQDVEEIIHFMNKLLPGAQVVKSIVQSLYKGGSKQKKRDINYELIKNLRPECLDCLFQTQRFKTVLLSVHTEILHRNILQTIRYSLEHHQKEVIVTLLWVLLNSWLTQGTLWGQLETVFKYLKMHDGLIQKSKELFEKELCKFLSRVLDQKFERFCIKLLKDKIEIIWFRSKFEKELVNYFRENMNSERVASQIYNNYLLPLRERFGILKPIFLFFFIFQDKFYQGKDLIAKLESALFVQKLQYQNEHKHQFSQKNSSLLELEILMKSFKAQTIPFFNARRLIELKSHKIQFYLQLASIQYSPSEVQKIVRYIKKVHKETSELKYFYEINSARLKLDVKPILGKIIGVQNSFSQPLSQMRKNFDKIKYLQRPQSMTWFYQLKGNRIFLAILDQELRGQKKLLDVFDDFVMDQIIPLARQFLKKCLYFHLDTNSLDFATLYVLMTDYPLSSLRVDLQNLARVFQKQEKRDLRIKNLEQLQVAISTTVRILRNLKLFSRILAAMAILQIREPQSIVLQKCIKELNWEGCLKLKFNEILLRIKPLEQLSKNLPLQDQSFDQFLKVICRSKALFTYLQECQNISFEDFLDVIDDTSLEIDELVPKIVRVQTIMKKFKLKLNQIENPVACLIEAYQLWNEENVSGLLDCALQFNRLKDKIEDKFHSSGRTIEKLKNLWCLMHIRIDFSIDAKELVFQRVPLIQRRDSKDDKEIEVISVQEFQQLIKKGLMLKAQYFLGNEEEKQQKERDLQINTFQRILERTEQIRLISQKLQNLGCLNLSNLKITLKGDARSVLQKISTTVQNLELQLTNWTQNFNILRKEFYSLNLISPLYFEDVMLYFESGSFLARQNVRTILGNLHNKPNELIELNISSLIQKDKNPHTRLRNLGKCLTRFVKPQFIEARNLGFQNQSLKHLKRQGLLVARVKGGEKLWESILGLFAYFGQFPTFHQVLFCSKSTQEHEIQQFLKRAFFFQERKYDILPFYLLASFEKLPLALQLQVKNQIDEFFSLQRSSQRGEKVKIGIIYEAQDLQYAHVIEDLKNPGHPPSLREQKFKTICRSVNSKVVVVLSRRAGLGKSHWIRKTVKAKKRELLQIPLYGQFSKTGLIKLIEQKRKRCDLTRLDFYLNVSQMREESIHSILFEILILHKLQVGHYLFSSFSDDSHFYIEVANTHNNALIKSLSYLSNFESVVQISRLELNNFDLSEDPESIEQYAFRYMSSMQKKRLSLQDKPNLRVPISKNRAVALLEMYFTSKVPLANFHQVQAFVRFLGTQFSLLDKSPYLSIEGLQFQGISPKFRQEVVSNLVMLGQDFASQIHRNEVDLEEESKEQRKKSEIIEEHKRLWEKKSGFLLAFNSDCCTFRLFYQSLNEASIPLSFQMCLKRLKEQFPKHKKDHYHNLKDFDDYTQDDLRQILLCLCTDPTVDQQHRVELVLNQKFSHIVLTKDNVIKIAMIYLRIRSGVPILVMGETGVGKTILINYLAALLQRDLYVLNVNPGLSQEYIASWVKQHAINDAEQSEEENKEWNRTERRKIILFFDEINTNPNINGILKEILVDRRVMGEPLPDFVVPIAASNPYKLRRGKIDALTKGLKIKGIKSSELVYLVNRLPESMLTSVWNFGSLLPLDELKYISKLVSKLAQQYQPLRQWRYQFTQAIQRAQNFMREKQEVFAVSLRDMARLVKVFSHFMKEGFSTTEAATLSFFFSYYCRLDQNKLREEFVLRIQAVSRKFESFYKVRDKALQILEEALVVEKGIALNMPLKENAFLIMVSIECMIPIILTGPPGTSKTLSTRLIYKNMKGMNSSSQYFKKKPKLILKSYQCSELSTSEGILNTFRRAEEMQQKYKNHRVVVILDEIGLAQKSHSNPLKVLHSQLQPPKVAFIGLSNWSLDAAKMNRAVHASRPILSAKDLQETALAIQRSINPKVSKQLLIRLSEQSFRYLEDISKREYYFHGTRDFYNLNKQICYAWGNRQGAGSSGADWLSPVIRALQRNLGGTSNIEEVLHFYREFLDDTDYKELLVDSAELVEDNLKDSECRNLMLITESPLQAIAHLESIADQQKRELRVFYGSDFEEDVTVAKSYDIIYEVIHCMEQGTCCVFFGLDHIYQSFYDLLNQNYSQINNKKICRIAIGSDNFISVVHPLFKVVVIVRNKDVQERIKIDPPLLNRFEKQRFSLAEYISPADSQLFGIVKKWLFDHTYIGPFKYKDAIPSYTEDTIPSIVLQHKNSKNPFKKCKQSLMWLFSLDGAIRATIKKQNFLDIYLDTLCHSNFEELMHYCQNYQDKVVWKDKMGFKLLIYSPDPLILSDTQIEAETYKRVELSALTSEKNLNYEIQSYFKSKELSLLVLVANVKEDSRERILLAKNRIASLRAQYVNNKRNSSRKNIAYHIRTVDKQCDGINVDAGWLSVQLETIPQLHKWENPQFLMGPLEEVLRKKVLKIIVDESFAQAISQLTYPEKYLVQEKQQDRVNAYSQIFKLAFQEDLFIEWLKCSLSDSYREKAIEEDEEWYLSVAMDPQIMRRHSQFHRALISSLTKQVGEIVANFLFVGEKESLISAFQKQTEQFKEMFSEQLLPLWTKKTIKQRNLDLRGFDLSLSYPFVRSVYEEILKLKSVFTKNENLPLWKKLEGMKGHSLSIIDPDIVALLETNSRTFIRSLSQLPQFLFSANPVTLQIIQELIDIFKIQSHSEVVGLLWQFQAFFREMKDIWAHFPTNLLKNNENFILYDFNLSDFKEKKHYIFQIHNRSDESEEEKQYIDSNSDLAHDRSSQRKPSDTQKIKTLILNWSLEVMIQDVLFDEKFIKNLQQSPHDSFCSTLELFYASIYNIIDEHALEANQEVIKNLEFFIELSTYLDCSFQTILLVRNFFINKPIVSRLSSPRELNTTMEFLTDLNKQVKSVKLRLYLYRKALINEINPQLLNEALSGLQEILRSQSQGEQDFGSILLQGKRLIKVVLKKLEYKGLQENLEGSSGFGLLSRAQVTAKLKMNDPLSVLIVDVMEETYFSDQQINKVLKRQDRVAAFENVESLLERLVKSSKNPVFNLFSLALFRGIVKEICEALSIQKQGNYVSMGEQLADTFNHIAKQWSQSQKLPILIYIARLVKSAYPRVTLPQLQQELEVFQVSGINFNRRSELIYPWQSKMPGCIQKDEKLQELLSAFSHNAIPQFMEAPEFKNVLQYQYYLLLLCLTQVIFKEEEIQKISNIAHFLSKNIDERRKDLLEKFLSREEMPEELRGQEYQELRATLYMIGATALILPRRCLTVKIVTGEEKIQDLFLPFMVDRQEDQNMNEYPQFSERNAGTGRGMEQSSSGIPERQQLTNPGYFQISLSLDEQIRNHGGLPLRIARFFYLSILFLAESLRNEESRKRREKFEDLTQEWRNLKVLSGYSKQELMALFYHIVKQYMKYYSKFDYLSLSVGEQNQIQALLNRLTLEREFIKYCVPEQKDFANILKDLLQEKEQRSLLAEGRQSNRNLEAHLRTKKEPNLELFKVKLAQKSNSEQSKVWSLLRNNSFLLRQAASLQALSEWLKYVHNKLFHKITRKAAQQMTVKKFCQLYEGKQQFNEMKRAWDEAQRRGLIYKGQEVKLPDISIQDTNIITFCLSCRPEDPGYVAWVLLRRLVSAHNTLHQSLSKIKQSRLTAALLPSQTRSLFGSEVVHFFQKIEFREDEGIDGVTEEYEIMDEVAKKFGVSDIRVGRGRELYFDEKQITKQLVDRYFNKIARIDEQSLKSEQFKFEGEMDIGNTIRDVKDRVKQECLTAAEIKDIEQRMESKSEKYELLEKVELALSLLQHNGANPTLRMLDYFKVFKINGVSRKLEGIQLKHIVHLYELMEADLFQDLLKETVKEYRVVLTAQQQKSAEQFYKGEEREVLAEFIKVMTRLQVRNLRVNPRLNPGSELYSTLFDEIGTFQDLWGSYQEVTQVQMQNQNWNQKYQIFQENGALCLEMRHVFHFTEQLKWLERKERRREEEQKLKQEEQRGRIEERLIRAHFQREGRPHRRASPHRKKVYFERGD